MGLGLSGATVSASTAPTATTTTGSDGTFSLQVTHSGSFTLTAAKTCYGTSTTESGAAAVTQEFTRIVMPRAVFTSCTQTDLNAIFGPGGNYVDLGVCRV